MSMSKEGFYTKFIDKRKGIAGKNIKARSDNKKIGLIRISIDTKRNSNLTAQVQ